MAASNDEVVDRSALPDFARSADLAIVDENGVPLRVIQCGAEVLSVATGREGLDDWLISITLAEAHGRLECVGVHIERSWVPDRDAQDRPVRVMQPEGLTATTLREVPLKHVVHRMRLRALKREENAAELRNAAKQTMTQIKQIRRGGGPVPALQIAGREVEVDPLFESALSHIAKLPAMSERVESPLAGRKPKYGADVDTVVVAAYRAAHLAGEPEREPARQALSNHLGQEVTLKTVDWLLARARRRGLLPPTRRGSSSA